MKTHSLELEGKKINIDLGLMAKQAAGACTVRMGDTTVLVTVVSSKEPRPNVDFLPLTVDYRERTYAAGKIPGGFFKREGRPRTNEILVSRLIDRSMRPLFPEAWHNDINLAALVLSFDGENDTDIASMIGASVALQVSDIPFNGPVGAVRIGRINGSFIVNPTLTEQKTSDLDLIVSGTESAITMVEAGAHQLSEQDMIAALELAHIQVKKICALQREMTAQTKRAVDAAVLPDGLSAAVEACVGDRVSKNVKIAEKSAREQDWDTVKKETVQSLIEKYPDSTAQIKQMLEDMLYHAARTLILKGRVRTDGRKFDEIRPINCMLNVLPRTHGSALFTRGQTQALATVTLGSPGDMQIMDELAGEYKERFMLHYNFPGFATGEAKPERGTSRREIGHGALARRSLLTLLPAVDDFPYTIRIVSDILESNGSSSMASVCGGSLSLFDAGVPLAGSCAGIAMGLVKEGDAYAILSDIMGMEDHLGDMDFKVAGTRKGITALQMDIKIAGITPRIMAEALEQARRGRIHILDIMDKALSSPRENLSSFAPRMVTLSIAPSKIGELIGPGGKNIRRIQEETHSEIDIDDSGKVFITAPDQASIEAASEQVQRISAEAEVGKIYSGRVTRIIAIGAFVEIMPGKEGLVHISQLDDKHVKRVEDVLKEGQIISVKVIEIDNQGRVNLSRKAVLAGAGAQKEERPRR